MKMDQKTENWVFTNNVNAHIDRKLTHTLYDNDISISINAIPLIGGNIALTAKITGLHEWLTQYEETICLGNFSTYKGMNRTLYDQVSKFCRQASGDAIGAKLMTAAVKQYETDDCEIDAEIYAEIVTYAAHLEQCFHKAAEELKTATAGIVTTQAA